ncbi:MAG: hypothetical protein U1E76_18865 [Planctomycetota bacterium]
MILLRRLLALAAALATAAAASAWREHWDATWEITFRYPAEWQLYTPEHPGPFGYFRANQLAACSAPDSQDTWFKLGVIFGAPPRPLAAKMEATFAGMARQLNATKLESRAFTISGCEALEWCHSLPRATPPVVQKFVAIAGAANGFMLSFNAPASAFAAVDRDVFAPMIEGVMLGERGMTTFWRQMWKRAPRAAKSAAVGLGLASVAAFSYWVLRRRPHETAAPEGGS